MGPPGDRRSQAPGPPSVKRVLVAYETMAGSTVEVAQAIGEELARSGLQVEVRPIGEVRDLRGYDAVVVGAPMILGWHRSARRFLRRHRQALQHIPLAVFVMAIIRATAGDRRNWPAIRAWAAGLPAALGLELPQPETFASNP